MQVYKILLPLNFNEAFDYLSDEPLKIGDVVKVPFRSGVKIGVVWAQDVAEIEVVKIKKVIEKLPLPQISKKLIKFVEFVAEYNMASLGNVLKMVLTVKFGPRSFNKIETIKSQEFLITENSLSEAQIAAAENLTNKVTNRKYSCTVLDGVTGSGKSEVYFEAIKQALTNNKQVLVLLPEIGLSIQWLQRFKQRFGTNPGIWHSDRTEKERRETWLGVITGKVKVVVGARSALFLPFQNLGLIIVDEEHDQSYKQEEGVIYHGRDMAVSRASIEHIPIVLVSATPSVETVNNVNEKKYELLHLPERFGGAVMPKMQIVDMRYQKLLANKFVSPTLQNAITTALENKQQVLMYLNRRGYAPLTLCRACGHRIQCPNCSAWLVMHKARHTLECHHCGFSCKQPDACPICKVEGKLAACGPGVERLRDEIIEYFPTARIEVLASDSPKSADDIITRMAAHEIDILIGTQMIAKGHHFAKLALVGVVDADLGLEGGDLRAAERTYQVLHQVSGRAGREEELGLVILQTYDPENIVIKTLVNSSRDEFINREIYARKRFEMPPFGKLATIVVSGKDEYQVKRYISNLAANAPQLRDLQLLGPAPAPMSYLRGQHRYRLILKAGKKFNMQKFINEMLEKTPTPSALKTKIDIDPFSFV